MLKVGITGGIGSGKTLVCQMFSLLKVPVLNADAAAKTLMNEDHFIKEAIIQTFGADMYNNDRLNRSLLASKVFGHEHLLQQLNAIVHPAVAQYTKQWFAQLHTPYAIKEAAIFFESGTHTEMDVMIGVYAPEHIRLQRVVGRDKTTAAAVQLRMQQQMNEEEKMKRCDIVIQNDGQHSIIDQVLSIHERLVKQSTSTP
jgi:dephospho-CoA kinase